MRAKNFWSDDRGDSNVATAVFGVLLLSMAAYAMSYSSLAATNSSKAAAESNRMAAAAESALSHAAWSLNDDPSKTSGTGTMSDGSDVKWKWTKAAGSTSTKVNIKATGNLGDRSVERDGVLVSVRTVGSEKFGDELRYVAGAGMASNYVLAGSEIKARNASWAPAASYISGKVAAFDGVEKPAIILNGVPTGGVDAYAAIDKSVKTGHINTSSAPMVLSSTLVKQQVNGCTSSRGSWKSSENGSKITSGSTICADVVTIDSPTTVTGAGTATIKAKKLVIKKDLTTTASNQVRAWVDGNVDFDLAAAGSDKTLAVSNAHIYAGAGTCRTLNGVTGAGLKFGGSMACKRIDAAGSFTKTATRTVNETTYPLWVAKGE